VRRVDAARTFWINDDRLLRPHGKSKHPRDRRRNRGGRRLRKRLPTSLMTEHWAATSRSMGDPALATTQLLISITSPTLLALADKVIE
jgi:hypothetical protein